MNKKVEMLGPRNNLFFCVKNLLLLWVLLGWTKFCVLAKCEPFHVSLFEGQLLHTLSVIGVVPKGSLVPWSCSVPPTLKHFQD
jgi:hypothetical protein